MTKKMGVILSSVLIVCLFTGTAYLCGPGFTFRVYLNKHFWQPFAKYEDSINRAEAFKQKKREIKPVENGNGFAFAGFSTGPASEALLKVRKAYIDESYDQAGVELAAAEKAGLVGKELEELLLIDAKLDMRMAEEKTPADRELLTKARQKLEAFLKTAQVRSWRSEARGWLARVHYLLGRHSSAVKIYLDELGAEDTVFDRESLVNSLHMIFPYNGSSARLADQLEDYFDTPAHALFVVYVVTNPVYSSGEERAAMAGVGRKVIDALQKHSELFSGTDLSDSLALALMRASIYMGDTGAALAYSRKISPASRTARTPEFNWMTAACYFLQKEYAQAESPLLALVRSQETNSREFRSAAQGLIGVYQKLGRRVDQLHAAFLYEKVGETVSSEPYALEQYAVYLPGWEWLLDVPYLLDIQLTDDELREYLVRYGKEARQIKYPPYPQRPRTAFEAVEYALAVRLARQEKYAESAEVYERLNAWPRAKRMRLLVDLYAKTADTALPTKEHLEAQYRYASFLEEHSTGVFFNDMVWKGYQKWTFANDREAVTQGFTGEERDHLLKEERRIQDEQEERWRAYRILAAVVERMGYTDLGRRTAVKAIRCLDLINAERFGRADEIDQAREKLLSWLRDYGSHANESKMPSRKTGATP